MPKVRKAKCLTPHPEHWEVTDTLRVEGRHPLVKGREVSITGVRGRYRFIRAVTDTETGAQWIDAIHPDKGGIRSFSVDRIRTVHSRTVKLRGAA